MSEQQMMDFDAPAKQARWAAAEAVGEQPGLVERIEAWEAWCELHVGTFDPKVQSPWPLWRLGFTVPGSLASAADLRVEREKGVHAPTAMTVDCRPDRYRPERDPGRPPYLLLYRGACLGCDWEGPAHPDENAAVEDAHDHTHPWWRELPAVDRPMGDPPKPKALAAVRELYEATVPGCTDDPLCPIVTWRQPMGTRHHHGGALGGFDMGKLKEGEVRHDYEAD